ncbi:MAG: phenylacetate--CoA ligase family protein [Monoglobus pectinilyticus]|uniref:phenylacetate--CoA ligase family protein n=1 Tax=Monoglobus pectinilyticus TaxID=1981510 RepID=UPI0039917CCA
MAIWNKDIETMPREKLEELQLKRLQETVNRVYENVKPYREKMDKAGIKPDDIKTLDDLSKLPLTVKQDLRDNYPYGMFAVPMEQVTEIHASSGTTGKQTVVGLTEKDVDIWAEIAARALSAMGVDKNSVVQTSYGFGLFTGGFGAHYGARKIGAVAIPTSSGNSKRQINIMKDFGSTFLCCTPSYALSLSETLVDMGFTKDDIKLQGGAFGAEPWTEEIRQEIQEKLGINAYDIYGLSEIMGPGVGYECADQSGMHINEDHFIVEVIDPETGEVVPDGSMGEIVFTCITKEALPLIRYRTRDIATINKGMCRCGRTFARMSKPMGRSDDMLIIRGVNVFPSQIEEVLMKTEGVAPHYQIIVDRINNKDMLDVLVEVSNKDLTDEIKSLEALSKKVSAEILSVLGIKANIKLVEPKTIARSEGKSVRVIDKRQLH